MKKICSILTVLVAFNTTCFASCDFGDNETSKEVKEVVVDVDSDNEEVNS